MPNSEWKEFESWEFGFIAQLPGEVDIQTLPDNPMNFKGKVFTASAADAAATDATSEEEVAPSPFEVVQIWECQMKDDTTEKQVEAIAADWLKAIRQMPGGAAVKMRVFFPAVASGAGNVDFYFVMNAPSFTDWGKIWDAYK
ncbi:MAG: hypothetical protein WBX20_01235, partial [Terrimicrobiaceae bacterium]